MKRAFTLIEALIIVGVIGLAAAILFPIFARSRDGHGRPTCQSPLKQIWLGFSQYQQDYDERFPPAHVTASTGWADVLLPYLKSTQIFHCPQAQSNTALNTTTAFSTDYFFNRRLARVAMDKVTSPALTIRCGDGDAGAPTWNSWVALPSDATTNSSSPSQRHMQGANYGFADGHVKWYSPDKISSTYAAPTSRPTFAVR